MDMTRIAVIGADTMGSGIAQVAAGHLGRQTGRGFYEYGN